MAAVTTTALEVAPVFGAQAEIYPAIAAVDLVAGELAYFNASGKLVKTNAGAAGTAKVAGMVMTTVKAGQGTDILKRGHTKGANINGLAYGAKVYASNNAGELADAAGTVSVVVGSVVPLTERGGPKVLYVDCDWKNL